MRDYRPRRCSVRWLDEDCPSEVLAILDNKGKTFDRYTVIYNDLSLYNGEWWLWYRGMSEHPSDPQGFGISADMKAYQVAEYRYRCKHQYAKWSSLPDDVKRVVIADCKAIKDSQNS